MNQSIKNLAPLSDEEMVIFKKKYTQNFDTMSVKEALTLFRMVAYDGFGIFDDFYRGLLLRRLHMIIDWTNYPERLI